MEYNDFEELSKIAYKGEELSDYAPLHTKYMYLRLVDLYTSFNKGIVNKEKSIKIKNGLRNEYKGLLIENQRDTEWYREYIKNRKENEMLLISLENSKDKDEMLKYCFKIISNCVNDKSLYERNMKKITT